ncbi:MAG: cyanophycinase [Planctomycetota bacterium]|jgi:cyanophycinase
MGERDRRNVERGFIIPIGGAEEKVRGPAILRRFVELCGGRDATIVIIPTASQDPDTASRYEGLFKDLGCGRTPVLPLTARRDCDSREPLDMLQRADGVFLTGGNQLRLSTILGGTKVASMLRRRNQEGLHIAGTSAGAAIMSEHMIAFGKEGPTPQADMVTLAPGLGFTRRLIIDQHFRQRDRLGRLLTAVSYNPNSVGLGLDEDTAAFLGPHEVLEVAGSGAITIVDPAGVEYSSMDSTQQHEPVSIIGVRLHILVEGGTFDLRSRKAYAAEESAVR